MTPDLIVELGKLRGTLDVVHESVRDIDKRTRAIEQQLAGNAASDALLDHGRRSFRETVHAVLGPAIGAVGGGLLVKFWP